MNKTDMTVIFALMVVTSLIIFYLYMNKEGFFTTTDPSTTIPPTTTTPTTPTTTTPTTTTPTTTTNTTTTYTCPPPVPPVPLSILSRYFGVGFNIYPVSSKTGTTQSTPQNVSNYLIEHIPTSTSGGVLGSMYAVIDGALTLSLRNDKDPSQWWTFPKLKDTQGDYYIVQPSDDKTIALQYSGGNLYLRPYSSPGYESQKWLQSPNKVTRGIPVLNFNQASLFSPEFNQSAYSSTLNNNNITDENNKQVTDVLNLVRSGIQQYLSQVSTDPQGNASQISASSLGNKDQPLNINVNLGESSIGSTKSGVSSFSNIDGTTSTDDIISLLDKYDSSKTTGSTTLYTGNDLQSQLNNIQGCKMLNINDYTSNRVGTCNCKL